MSALRATPSTVLLCLALAACQPAPHDAAPVGPEYLSGPSGPSPRLSEAVRVGDMLYLSGKLGTVPGTRQLAEGGIREETRQALENIRDVIERHGSSMNHVVKCTVFLVDIAEWPAMNEVYVTFFPQNPPARSAVAVSGLVLDARVEIECLAHAG